MRQLILWLCSTCAVVIKLSILNERILNPYSHQLTRILADDILSKYNKSLANFGIEIQIHEFLEYKEYSQIERYKQIAKLAGHSSIKKRLKALKNFNGNIILLVSTMEKPPIDKFNVINICRSRFFFSAYENGGNGSSDDSTPAPVIAINKWLSKLLRIRLPDPFSSEKIDFDSIDQNLIKKTVRKMYNIKRK